MEKDRDKAKQHIPISNVLEKVLDQDLYEKYKKKLGFSPTADYFYQWALISLNESNSDKAISFLISALDLERKHAPTLHLLKSMVVGLSKDFYENGGADYKQKYEDLDKLIDGIRKKAISIKRKNDKLKEEVEQVEQEMKKGFFITKYLKKKHFERQLLILKNEMVVNQDKIDIYKKEIRKIKKFQKNEEYSKILGTILEICIIPKRYGWVGNKTGVAD